MKEIIKEFLELFANSIMVICLALCSYLLLINLYHSREISIVKTINMEEYTSHKNLKTNLESFKQRLTNANNNKNYKTDKQKIYLDSIYLYINNCITAMQASDFYKLTGDVNITYNNIYDYNVDLRTDLRDACLFYPDHNITEVTARFGYIKNNYESIAGLSDIVSNQIKTSSDYINDRLLNNSSYHTSTEITKRMMFNEMDNMLALNINNYTSVVDLVGELVDWFTVEAGGSYE